MLMDWRTQHSNDVNSWAGGVAQVVEQLPSKHEALSSNPRAEKKEVNSYHVDVQI
jgi:hypothetical protein